MVDCTGVRVECNSCHLCMSVVLCEHSSDEFT